MWESRLSGSERALREGAVEENSTRQPSWLLDCLTLWGNKRSQWL